MESYKNRDMKYTYGRNGTPTSDSLINAISSIYDAEGCVLASSGMNAISTALMSVLMAGDHILLPDCIYGSTRRFAQEEFPRLNIEFDFYNSRDLSGMKKLIKNNTKVIYLESPGTYTFEIIDIKKVINICEKYKIKSIIDNTWATAIYFNPLNFGVNIVVEAITKYISGHSDIMMGVVVANKDDLLEIQRWTKNAGVYVSPDDIYMSLRGLRTLPLRLKESSKNSLALAKHLEQQDEIKLVQHPALKQHPDYNFWKKYFKGASGLFAVEFNENVPNEAINILANNLNIFGIGASWGGYSSLVSTMDVKASRNVNTSYVPKGPYLRIYTGSENIKDLKDDFDFGLNKMREFIAK
jgi:cystathionine beta-lyase